MNPARARIGSGQLPGDWDAKKPETLKVKKPLHRRRWARRLALVAFGVVILALGIASAVLVR